MRQLAAMDAMWLHLNNEATPAHGTLCAIYQPEEAREVTFEQFRRHVASRFGRASAFRLKLAPTPFDIDYPYWTEAEDVDLDYHVQRTSLPEPHDRAALYTHFSTLATQHLDMDRPLWQVYFVDGLSAPGWPRGSFATFFKVHHAALDGSAAMEMVAALHDTSPDAKSQHVEPTEREDAPGWLRMGVRAGTRSIVTGTTIARSVPTITGRVARIAVAAARGEMTTAKLDRPDTIFDRPVTNDRVVVTRECDVKAMKRIKAQVAGATFDDALLTVVSGTLRRYLSGHDALPDKSLTTALNLNARDSDDPDGGNQTTVIFIPLHTDIADPLERLTRIHKDSSRALKRNTIIGVKAMGQISNVLPAPMINFGARQLMNAAISVNTIVTNVPGSPAPLYLCGAHWIDAIACAPLLEKVGLVHGLFGIEDRSIICVTSCPTLLPDPEVYGDAIEATLDEYGAL